MRMKRFLLAGIMSLMLLTGCTVADAAKTPVQEKETSTATGQEVAQDEKREEQTAVEATPSSEEVAKEQIQTLGSFMGKTAHDVNLALGEPSASKNIQDSKLLAANYYRVDFCDEVAKVEVNFDVDSQKVNYVSFAIIDADHIDATKEMFIQVLTNLYGESTIERFMDVKGKQRRDWNDGVLNYDLRYYENNISLEIYPLDK